MYAHVSCVHARPYAHVPATLRRAQQRCLGFARRTRAAGAPARAAQPLLHARHSDDSTHGTAHSTGEAISWTAHECRRTYSLIPLHGWSAGCNVAWPVGAQRAGWLGSGSGSGSVCLAHRRHVRLRCRMDLHWSDCAYSRHAGGKKACKRRAERALSSTSTTTATAPHSPRNRFVLSERAIAPRPIAMSHTFHLHRRSAVEMDTRPTAYRQTGDKGAKAHCCAGRRPRSASLVTHRAFGRGSTSRWPRAAAR
jgi:hypothetical protein